jgi:hypothetical protein
MAGLQFGYPKPSGADEFVNLAVEVATASDMLPKWCEPVLPSGDTGIRSMTMFHKNEAPLHL